mmetsp:Transcript_12899/g.12992  ORF Transcript_12899/g.12992 Transcript_12899/m.12992 type:complete len:206 (-) Transcript_12899:195-812(-)
MYKAAAETPASCQRGPQHHSKLAPRACLLRVSEVGGVVDLGSGGKDPASLTLSQGAVVGDQAGVDAIVHQAALLAPLDEVLTHKVGEAPVAAGNDLLAARELELGAAQGLLGHWAVLVLAADAEQDLANLDTCASAVGLAEGTTHASLQAISACAGKHLVDAQHVEGVHAHTQVERLLAGILHHVLVGSHTGSLKCLTAHVLLLP